GEHGQARPNEAVRGVANPVEYFVEGAVATGSCNGIEAFKDSLRSQAARVARFGGLFEGRLRGDFVQMAPKSFGFFTPSGRIEDHANAHGPSNGHAPPNSRE